MNKSFFSIGILWLLEAKVPKTLDDFLPVNGNWEAFSIPCDESVDTHFTPSQLSLQYDFGDREQCPTRTKDSSPTKTYFGGTDVAMPGT